MKDEPIQTIEAIADTGDESKLTVPDELRLLALRDTVLFPLVVSPLSAGRESSIKLIDDAVTTGERIIAVSAMKNPRSTIRSWKTFIPSELLSSYTR